MLYFILCVNFRNQGTLCSFSGEKSPTSVKLFILYRKFRNTHKIRNNISQKSIHGLQIDSLPILSGFFFTEIQNTMVRESTQSMKGHKLKR